MYRQNILVSLRIQFPNAVQPPQWNAPVLITQASVVTDNKGTILYQPAFPEVPAAASDISDELLIQLQIQMAALGLQVSRVEVPAPAEVSE